MPLSASDRSRIAEMNHLLAVYVEGRPATTEVIAPLRELLRFDLTIAYGVQEVGDEFRLSFSEAEGGCGVSIVRRVLSSFIDGRTVRFAGYDPRRPEPWNRNKVLDHSDLTRHGVPTAPIVEIAMPKLGVSVSEQLRVLVCEGPSLLAWVGGFRHEPYTQRDRRVLGALVPSLRRRLTLERMLASADSTRAALEVAMEAIGAPAYLVSALGTPILANSSGRAELDADLTTTRSRLSVAVRGGQTEEFRVVPVRSPGSPLRYLVIGRATPRVRLLAQAAAQRWGLSPRQQQVLGWLIEGASNARVGAELRIAERTVETHVTAILHRAQVGSRAELIAEVLKG